MAKNLVIVESPTKCRTISKYLGREYAVRATMGHIMDLPEKELGVDIEHDFAPKYQTSKGKRKVLKALKDDARKAERVYLAPDPDREGEAIAWHVAQLLDKGATKVYRVLFNEVTRRAVLAAFKEPREIDMHKVNAQQARRILDRIVGYQVSPLLWRTVYRGLSAGRVQSVALRLICEREDEIKAFRQEEYWSVSARIVHEGAKFTAKLQKVEGRDVELPNGAAAAALVEQLRGREFMISDVQRSEKTRRPYPPFITSTLQQEAARKLGFSAARTMAVAQQLYEGLELGELGAAGLITYMRTDSTRIAAEALADARRVIKELYGEKRLPGSPQVYSKSTSAQDAHEAIRPAQVAAEMAPERVKQYLSRDQFRLYELVWKRFLASQMAPAVYDATRLDISAGNCLFRATGAVVKFDGFLALYDETREETGENGEGENERLPEIAVGTVVVAEELTTKQHFTQPPPRYTEASLVRELEDKGIGRPSTYAQIIDTLKRRGYVTVEKRRFTPTEVGRMVKELLVREFPDIFNVEFTSRMESDLDKVEDGHADWVSVLREFYRPFRTRLDQVTVQIKDLRARHQEVTERMCPVCNQHRLVIKWSRNGRFLACQGFPNCKYTEPLEKVAAGQSAEVCDKCGAPMVVVSRGSNRFLGCSRYPECRNTRNIATGVHCPQKGCDGMLVQRTTRRGKVFFGCNKYPTCTFATWDEPVARACTRCGFSIVVRRESRSAGMRLRCPNCRAEIPVESVASDAVAGDDVSA